MRRPLGIAAALTIALCAAADCDAQTPGTAGTGLEATGPEVNSAPAATVLLDAGAAPAAVPPLANDRSGKLENYIRGNPSTRKAEPRLAAGADKGA